MHHELWNIEPDIGQSKRLRHPTPTIHVSAQEQILLFGFRRQQRLAQPRELFVLGMKVEQNRIGRCCCRKFLQNVVGGTQCRHPIAGVAAGPGLAQPATSRTCIFQGGETDREFGGRLIRGRLRTVVVRRHMEQGRVESPVIGPPDRTHGRLATIREPRRGQPERWAGPRLVERLDCSKIVRVPPISQAGNGKPLFDFIGNQKVLRHFGGGFLLRRRLCCFPILLLGRVIGDFDDDARLG